VNPPPASWYFYAPQSRDRATEVQGGADPLVDADGVL
jgi:hypothetical protein